MRSKSKLIYIENINVSVNSGRYLVSFFAKISRFEWLQGYGTDAALFI